MEEERTYVSTGPGPEPAAPAEGLYQVHHHHHHHCCCHYDDEEDEEDEVTADETQPLQQQQRTSLISTVVSTNDKMEHQQVCEEVQLLMIFTYGGE